MKIGRLHLGVIPDNPPTLAATMQNYGPLIDVACPDCQWPDQIILRSLYRHELQGVHGKTEVRTIECGKVVRCARCVKEFCIGPSGVYVPFPLQDKEVGPADAKRRAVPPPQPAPHADQPWNKG